MTLLTGKAIWKRIGTLIRESDVAIVAVPYLGEGAAKMLPLKPGSILVTRYEVSALKAGQISPNDIIELLNRGVRVFTEPALHAKIYAFANRVIIGSSNASKTSKDRLVEACVEIEDRTTIKAAKAYVLKHTKCPITPEFARELAPYYKKPSHFPMMSQPTTAGDSGKTRAANDLSEHALWLLPTEPLGETSSAWKSASAAALAAAQKRVGKEAEIQLDTLAWTKEAGKKLSVGDNLLMRQTDKNGVDWIWPPAIVHSIIKTPGKDSYAVAYSQVKNAKRRRLDVVQEKLGDSAKSLASLKYTMRRASPKARSELLGLWGARDK